MKIKLKNFLRLIFALWKLIFEKVDTNKNRIYFNLIGRNVTGGPDRFLKSITSSDHLKDKFEITNWSLKGCRSALVFSSSWGNSFTTLCRLLNVKSVLRVDGFYVPDDKIDEDFQLSLSFRRWLNSRLKKDLIRFDHIIYQSNFSKEICDKYLFKREKNFSIIANGTNVNYFQPNLKINNEKLKIVVLGKHYPKHLNLALDIFTEVLNVIDAEMIIIGPLRNGVDGVSNYINKSGREDKVLKNIKCLGIKTYDQLPSLLSSADIFLHVKVGDWCPNAVLEAMASGLPVVCPSWGGTKELVGDAGVIVEGPEWEVSTELTEGMVQGILKISKSLLHYKKLARSRTINEFNIEDVSKKYLNVLGF